MVAELALFLALRQKECTALKYSVVGLYKFYLDVWFNCTSPFRMFENLQRVLSEVSEARERFVLVRENGATGWRGRGEAVPWVPISSSKYLHFHFEFGEGQNTKIPSKYQNPFEV